MFPDQKCGGCLEYVGGARHVKIRRYKVDSASALRNPAQREPSVFGSGRRLPQIVIGTVSTGRIQGLHNLGKSEAFHVGWLLSKSMKEHIHEGLRD